MWVDLLQVQGWQKLLHGSCFHGLCSNLCFRRQTWMQSALIQLLCPAYVTDVVEAHAVLGKHSASMLTWCRMPRRCWIMSWCEVARTQQTAQ